MEEINSQKHKKGRRGASIKFEKPSDLFCVYHQLKNENRLSVNAIKNHYNIASPSIIKRWLNEEGLDVEKSNEKKEEIIDIDEFIKACQSGEYSLKEISIQFNINLRHIKSIIRRNSIENCSFITESFSPTVEEFLLIAKSTKTKSEIAKHYNTTLAIIINYIKRNKIEQQVKECLYPIEPKKLKQELRDNPNHSIGSLSRKVGLNASVITRILSENKIKLPLNQFDRWSAEYQSILNRIDYFVEINKQKTLLDISKEHNVSVEQLKRAFRETRNQVILHSYNKSKGELEVKEFIKSCGFDCNSVKKLYDGKRYEIDCFVPQLNLGIEFCGEYWHSENRGTDKNYHQDKALWCSRQGIYLLTIFQHEWEYKRSVVESIIRHKLGITKNKVFARNTTIEEITSQEAKLFHNENHLNGYVNSTINIALRDKNDNEILSVVSLSKPRFDNKIDLELTRFSTKKDLLVVGGLSKFISVLPRNTSILTYVDLRIGRPNSYKNQGFNILYESSVPNYFYFDKNNPDQGFHSRIKFQKHKLKKLFPHIFDPSLSEKEIMERAGYFRVYDCGNAKLSLYK
jgi:AraC-like DNA-binding protein